MMHIVLQTIRTASRADQFRHAAARRINKRIGVYAAMLNSVSIISAGITADYLVSAKGVSNDNFIDASCIACLFHIFFAYNLKAFAVERHRRLFDYCSAILLAWAASLLVLSLTAFAFKSGDHFSRFGAVVFALQGSTTLLVVSALYYHFIKTRLARGAITTSLAQIIVLQRAAEGMGVNWTCPSGTELTGFHYVHAERPIDDLDIREIADSLRQAVALDKCDCVYIVCRWDDQPAAEYIVNQLGPLSASVHLVTNPPTPVLRYRHHLVSDSLVSFELQKAPLSWLDRIAKRTLDLTVAGSALLLLSPLMILTAVAILLESGRPIFFFQDRRGFGQLPFKIFKFRTMYTLDNGADIKQARRGDARITPLGRILRKTSIDELPQLFNVILGDMSIVGPRPHAIAHDDYYDKYVSDYAFRHHVKPGITGWAQVNGHRGATETPADMQLRIDHDIWYINNWSIWLDVSIVIRTAMMIFNDKNAY